MAVVSGYARDDPKYLKFLEDEYVRREREDKEKIKKEGGAKPTDEEQADAIKAMSLAMKHMSDKLDSLETNVATLRDGISSTDPDISAAADLLTSPLTKALAHLGMEDDEEGRPLRPETYAQSDIKGKNRDYTKMDTVDLLFGWIT